MGRDKALLPWPPAPNGQTLSKDTFLSAAIDALLQTADFVVVVAGRNQAALTPVAYIHGASVVTNPEPDRGQFSSLQIGLRDVLNRGRDTAIVTLVDRPPAKILTLEALRDAFDAAPRTIWTVVPEFSGRHGHPYIAGREMIEKFLQAPPSGNARDIEHRFQERIRYLKVEDPFVTMNVNTPEEYAALLPKPLL